MSHAVDLLGHASRFTTADSWGRQQLLLLDGQVPLPASTGTAANRESIESQSGVNSESIGSQ